MGDSSNTLLWTSGDQRPGRRYDAWVSKLNDTFGRWRPEVAPDGDFDADVSARDLGGLNVVECRCDPCGAERTRADVDGPEQLTLQLVVSGREYMRLGSEDALLRQGDVFVWDSTQPMSFSVVERLHKISLVMPLQRLKDWLPNSWRALPRWIPSSSPSAELMGAFIRSVARGSDATPMRSQALIEAAVAILAAPIYEGPPNGSQRSAQLALVKQRILERLSDPDLRLDAIAATHRMSLRYLHWLFEQDEQTAWRFITAERLKRCRQDLSSQTMSHRTITEIAFASGFSDASHFSRKFRQEFGISAREYRQRAIG